MKGDVGYTVARSSAEDSDPQRGLVEEVVDEIRAHEEVFAVTVAVRVEARFPCELVVEEAAPRLQKLAEKSRLAASVAGVILTDAKDCLDKVCI